MRRLEYLADGVPSTVLDAEEEDNSALPPALYRRAIGAPADYQPGPLPPAEYRDVGGPEGYAHNYLMPEGLDPAEYVSAEPGPVEASLPAHEYRGLDDSGQMQSEPTPRSRTPALDAEEAIYGQMPQRTPPKWYQRLGAAALGGAVGWTNAAGRVRPIDDTQGVENILHPGYQSKMLDWKNRLLTAEQRAGIEAKRTEMDQKERKLASDIAYQKAHADYMEGEGRSTLVEVTPAMEKSSGGQLKAGTKVSATLAAEAMRIEAGKYNEANRTTLVTDPEMAKLAGAKVGDYVPISTYNEAVRARNRQPTGAATMTVVRDPAIAAALHVNVGESVATSSYNVTYRGLHPTRDPGVADNRADLKVIRDAQDADRIDRDRRNEELRINQQRSQALGALSNASNIRTPEEKTAAIARINEQARQEMQTTYDVYAQSIRRRPGGTADDFDIQIGYAKDPKTGQIADPNGYLTAVPRRKTAGGPVSPGIQAAADAANAITGGRGPVPLSPQVKAYADKYFRGDVAKAQAAIAQQRAK